MRLIAWIIRVMLFLAALGFALSNTGITELRFFGVDVVWRAPLVIFLLAFFAAGTAMGLLGVVPMLFRQRREIGRLRREIKTTARPIPAAQPAPPDVPATGPIVNGLPLR
ncbi:MAG TPA: LapA family protein [Burkholderiaceae bacterium]|jgi:uncharacterized integral membrane protein|nr:LapA family protein [Burkholderiaceae bacterium]